MKKTIRWGIMGPGRIAHEFVQGLLTVKEAKIVAVGSRDLKRAEEFTKKYKIPKAYGSYDELVADDEIDVIYIATPHPYHKECALLCLNNGKAVLCEKPFTINAGELKEVIAKAREKKLFLMEGMWTRFIPAVIKAREWIQQGLIGDIRCFKADIGFGTALGPEERILNRKLGGGALLDIGVYPISFASMIFGKKPASIHSTPNFGATGVDEQCAITLHYDKGEFAHLFASVRKEMVRDGWIYGTKGFIHIPDFLQAKEAKLYLFDGTKKNYKPVFKSTGYQYEAIEVMKCMNKGKIESDVMPLDESISIMETMDGIRKDWNFYYPGE